MQRGLGLFLCLLFLEGWRHFIKSILIQSHNNSNAIWPRAEADGEPLIRMKTCDRFVFYCWGWWARGGGGVRSTSPFQKDKKKKINDRIFERYWDENNSSIWLFKFGCVLTKYGLPYDIYLKKGLGLNRGPSMALPGRLLSAPPCFCGRFILTVPTSCLTLLKILRVFPLGLVTGQVPPPPHC